MSQVSQRRTNRLSQLLFSFCLLINAFSSYAQDTCAYRISLLTCAPGEALYSTFGHTAIRVQTPQGDDIVFNYGTFEFSPKFYSQFIRGKLLYYLTIDDFQNFREQYRYESRSIMEQQLLLSCQQKQTLFEKLIINARPENRSYRYDFLFDNCTTRAGEMIFANAGDSVVKGVVIPTNPPTFRDMIHSYLDRGGQEWSKLGIDILLGPSLDRQVTNQQALFLPDYLLQSFERSTVNGRPLVKQAETILGVPSALGKRSLITPSFIFFVLLIAAALISNSKKPAAVRAGYFIDLVLFLLLSLTGLLLLFMWFGTDHTVCRNNLNLLWALPVHVITLILLHKKTSFAVHWFRYLFIYYFILLAAWFFLPQEMNSSLLAIIILVLLRSWFIYKQKKDGRKEVQF